MSRCGLVRASVVAGLALSMAGPVRAQSSPTASDGPAGEATPTKTQAGALPVSLDRIRAALEAAPESRLKLPDRPTFSIEVEGHPPRIDDFLDPAELRRGPAMPMAMTHQ